jgi:putative FmdB family regulatory protein
VPLYEYQCAKCHKRTEKIENLSGPYLKKCPHCGGKLERTLTAPSIQFKGSGWYVNDYATKPKGDGEGATPAKSESKEAPKESAAKDSASKDSAAKDSKESKEKKPAKKKD